MKRRFFFNLQLLSCSSFHSIGMDGGGDDAGKAIIRQTKTDSTFGQFCSHSDEMRLKESPASERLHNPHWPMDRQEDLLQMNLITTNEMKYSFSTRRQFTLWQISCNQLAGKLEEK